ncbi:MAG: MlaD family protein [Planctomycetaceae bacterium]
MTDDSPPAGDVSESASTTSQTSPTAAEQPHVPLAFPVAEIREAAAVGGILTHSRMWWVTVGCVILAGWLAWRSQPETGPVISIRFPEGHGLKSGDAVRFRGIDVGSVTAVTLNESLAGITAEVTLTPGGGNLDREGTRFWIVRPRFSLTEVSGLETAVGAKYIAVSPPEPGAVRQRMFDGLSAAPPDELSGGGLEVILRSDDRRGINAGAPITWRGVTVGQVLTVNLSPDARHVDFGARIDRAYRRLLRPSSKFWINSGFGMDVGLSGIKLTAQSVETILQGGISLITPAGGSDGNVTNGQVFRVAETAEKEWLESASTVPLIELNLPETVTITGQRSSSLLGLKRQRPFVQQGILITHRGGTALLTAQLPTTFPEGSEEPVLNDFQVQSPDGSHTSSTGISTAACTDRMDGVVQIPISGVSGGIGPEEFRIPKVPEECLAVRSAVTEGKATPVIQAIDPEFLEDRTTAWSISGSDVDFSQWHGAPVVAVSDGKIIGMLLSDSGGNVIALERAPLKRTTDPDSPNHD